MRFNPHGAEERTNSFSGLKTLKGLLFQRSFHQNRRYMLMRSSKELPVQISKKLFIKKEENLFFGFFGQKLF